MGRTLMSTEPFDGCVCRGTHADEDYHSVRGCGPMAARHGMTIIV